MELTAEQKKALEEQKANCIFCQIVSGSVQAKKVYEDENIIAILDINPASKGHTLVMPKEHYPIMPLMSPQEMRYFFLKLQDISNGINKGAVCVSNTIFMANGAAAGQQSNHFMAHIIPRDPQDDLSNFDVPQNEVPENASLAESIKKKLDATIKRDNNPQAEPKSIEFTHDNVVKILKASPKLVDMMKNDRDEFKKMIPTSPELTAMFKENDVDEIIAEIIDKEDKKKEKDNESKESEEKTKQGKEKPDLDKIAGLFK